MTIIVHRGTHQIGGCATELRTAQTRILIDIGAELPGPISPELEIEGITTGEPNCDAVFITHYHGDHVGLYKKILPGIPVYMGAAAKKIYLAFARRVRDDGVDKIEQFLTFHDEERIQMKNMTVTPLAVDHSAFDAYMFLVEGDGKRILHTGDFRLHGFGGDYVLPTIQKYAGQVDVLITEGTALSRKERTPLSERELEQRAREIIAANKYVFVLCASTNIDRIAAFYRATPMGTYFLCDGYQKALLEIVSAYSESKSSHYQFKKALVYGENLDEKLRRRGFCMLVRGGDAFRRIMDKFPDAAFLYSMWPGYLEGPHQNESLAALASCHPFQILHASGHASKEGIAALCNAAAPKFGVIAIHSDHAQGMDTLALSCPVVYLNDKQECAIG